MAEDKSFIGKVSNIFKQAPEFKQDENGERIAVEALQLVASAGPENQAPQVQYYKDIDFKKWPPGTVFRILDERPSDKKQKFIWMAIGAVDSVRDQLTLYAPKYPFDVSNLKSEMEKTYEKLELRPGWTADKFEVGGTFQEVSEISFRIFHPVLGKLIERMNKRVKDPSDTIPTRPENQFNSVRVDIMHAGIRHRQGSTDKIPQLRELIPALKPVTG